MIPMVSWWRALSGPEKFRLYTQLTLQGATVAVVIAAMVNAVVSPWSMTVTAVAGIAAVVAIQAQPDLSLWSPEVLRRWAIPSAAVILTLLWLVCAVMALRASDDDEHGIASGTGVFAALLSTIAIAPFSRYRWWIVAALAVASGAAFGTTPADAVRVAFLVLVVGAFIVVTTLLTMWGLGVVDELERTKTVEARLQVAEERLRFARDLHDVVGRSFSAIAVKSELAGTLSRAGAAERAAAEIDEVKTLAVESLDQMRELVRGYRGIDLENEVAGARSLLAAVGCELVAQGDATGVPARCHEVAAWVVREGTTNIVRHSTATSATLTLGAEGMSLSNNGASATTQDTNAHSGLLGLTERLARVGATLDIDSSGAGFLLEIHWEHT